MIHHPEQEPTREEAGGHRSEGDIRETHPAFGNVTVARISGGNASLFDSEVRHNHFVRVTVRRSDRTRALHRDWMSTAGMGLPLIEFDMSEAQWASLVSAFGNGGGVPCTIRATESDPNVPGIPFAPRLELSTAETKAAAERQYERVKAALAAVEEKPTKANVRSLRLAVDQAAGNVAFAAESLTEHTENVVQKARADIEAMAHSAAVNRGLSPAEFTPLAIEGRD